MRRASLVAAFFLLILPPSLAAGLSRGDQKLAKQMLKGTLWLRLDAPCETGRHPYGIYHSPLIEVSPEGANTDVRNQVNIGWYHAGSTDWSVRINDSVALDDAEFDDAEVEVEFEGVGASEGRDSTVRFVRIHSLVDFQAAFDHTFARAPLQDEHPEWPAEIREAIAGRSLANGMTKRQAFYVVGQPETVETKTEAGVEVELWTLRQKGMQFGFFGASAAGPQAARVLRFEGGRLALASGAVPGSALKLGE